VPACGSREKGRCKAQDTREIRGAGANSRAVDGSLVRALAMRVPEVLGVRVVSELPQAAQEQGRTHLVRKNMLKT